MGSGLLPKSARGQGKRPRLLSLAWTCLLFAASAACAAAPIHLASISHHHHVHRRHRRAAAQPNLRSSEALVLDASNHKVLYARKADTPVPIASITKLMTTLVVSEAKQPLDEELQVTEADRAVGIGAYSRLAVGTRLSRAELFHLALMASENRAAHALCRNYPGGVPACVRAMNEKARE